MMAKKPESRNVTMMDSAARSPAMTMTNAARINKVRDELEKVDITILFVKHDLTIARTGGMSQICFRVFD